MSTIVTTHRPPSAGSTILLAGLASGALDLLFAFTFYGVRYGVTPVRILQTIGSGVFGAASRDMGWTSAAVGLICHFVILIVASALFFFAARRLSVLTRQAFWSGVAYGIVIYLVMNYIVVPLSAVPPRPPPQLFNALGELGSHLLLVGLSIAYLVRRYYRAHGQ